MSFRTRTSRPPDQLSRSLAVLQCFEQSQGELDVPSICATLGLKRSVAGEYLRALESLKYLRRVGEDSYRLDLKVLDAGFSAVGATRLIELAADTMRRLCSRTGFEVGLALLDGAEVVYLRRSCSPSDGGGDEALRLPACYTVAGRFLLASMSHAERNLLMSSCEDPGLYDAVSASDLQEIANRGVLFGDQSCEPQIREMAVGVCDHQDEVVASLCLICTQPQRQVEEMTVHKFTLGAAAAQISAKLTHAHVGRSPVMEATAEVS